MQYQNAEEDICETNAPTILIKVCGHVYLTNTLKFDRHLGNTAAGSNVKFQLPIAWLRYCPISNVLSDIETAPRLPFSPLTAFSTIHLVARFTTAAATDADTVRHSALTVWCARPAYWRFSWNLKSLQSFYTMKFIKYILFDTCVITTSLLRHIEFATPFLFCVIVTLWLYYGWAVNIVVVVRLQYTTWEKFYPSRNLEFDFFLPK